MRTGMSHQPQTKKVDSVHNEHQNEEITSSFIFHILNILTERTNEVYMKRK